MLYDAATEYSRVTKEDVKGRTLCGVPLRIEATMRILCLPIFVPFGAILEDQILSVYRVYSVYTNSEPNRL
jgi:hypothetical protein